MRIKSSNLDLLTAANNTKRGSWQKPSEHEWNIEISTRDRQLEGGIRATQNKHWGSWFLFQNEWLDIQLYHSYLLAFKNVLIHLTISRFAAPSFFGRSIAGQVAAPTARGRRRYWRRCQQRWTASAWTKAAPREWRPWRWRRKPSRWDRPAVWKPPLEGSWSQGLGERHGSKWII